MTPVEQAVFTSAQTERSAGYQVVAKSPGVAEADARELAVWCPSHDSLLETGPQAASINFHPLPSGAYCVSRTTPAGWEYSGRGGHRVYTHCLLVPPEVLARFGNNPFALLRAAVAGGAVAAHDDVPARLDPLPLLGGASPVDQGLLARLAANPGPQRIAALVQAAVDCPCLAVAGPPSPELLIAGLLSCLPPECRTQFSFSTGLKFSSRRPFRMVALPGDRAEQRWIAHQPGVVLLDLSEDVPQRASPLDGWARLVARVLATGRTSLLAAQLSKRRFDLTLADLPALGLQLLEDTDASNFRNEHKAQPEREPDAAAASTVPGSTATAAAAGAAEAWPAGTSPSPAAVSKPRAHSAHRRFEKSGQSAPAVVAPSELLHPDSATVLEKLERLDDVVYNAIGGQATALDELETLWPQLLAELGEPLVAESREQYLRYALAIWEQSVDGQGVRNPARAVQALDVLCVLFDAS